MAAADDETTNPTWQTTTVARDHDYIAPDGSEVRLLLRLSGASMAQFRLPAGSVSDAVAHRTIEEYWHVTGGRGQMWLASPSGRQTTIDLAPGVSIALRPHTHFQFRSHGPEPLTIVGTSVPGWPGAGEAYSVNGIWEAGTR